MNTTVYNGYHKQFFYGGKNKVYKTLVCVQIVFDTNEGKLENVLSYELTCHIFSLEWYAAKTLAVFPLFYSSVISVVAEAYCPSALVICEWRKKLNLFKCLNNY